MLALIEGDLARASTVSGIPFTPFYSSDDIVWLWSIREEQIAQQPASADWVAFAVVDEETGSPVGHAGFHGPPDEHGLVELSYTIDPQFRGRGFAKASVAALLDRAAEEKTITTVRATISPDNAASLAIIANFEFSANGAQWDDEDGRELIFDRANNSTDHPSVQERNES